MLRTFFSNHVSVFSNLSSAEKASVKDKGRLLTDCAYEALTLWVCMFLNFHNAPCPTEIDREIMSTVIDLSLSSRRFIVIHDSTCTSIFKH